jgi:hypothetical protein
MSQAKYPFPGMDPYLEHPILWEPVHTRLIVAIANQLQPLLDPRYIASIEQRIYLEGPQNRKPDVSIEKVRTPPGRMATLPKPRGDKAVIVEVQGLEMRERRVEILDSYDAMKLVAVIELVSPTNKRSGQGRRSYLEKQEEVLSRDCHFIEIDLIRNGRHVLSVPEWRLEEMERSDYLVCVSRWPHRHRYELYPRSLRERLPRVQVPLVEPDADVVLDLQAALELIHHEGRFGQRLRYDEPCDPPLPAEEQAWADERLAAFRAKREPRRKRRKE